MNRRSFLGIFGVAPLALAAGRALPKSIGGGGAGRSVNRWQAIQLMYRSDMIIDPDGNVVRDRVGNQHFRRKWYDPTVVWTPGTVCIIGADKIFLRLTPTGAMVYDVS